MNIKLFCTFLMICLGNIVFAQSNEPYQYLDSAFEPTDIARNTVYYTIVDLDRSILKNNIITFDLKGKVRRYEQMDNYLTGSRHGVTETWYDSGELLSSQQYAGGKRHGLHNRYRRDGSLIRSEEFKDDQRVAGQCYDRYGNEVSWFEETVIRPSFPGGIKAFEKFVLKEISRRNLNFKGKIIAHFWINAAGDVENIAIVRKIHPDADAALIEVLKKSPKWIPGSIDGEPQAMEMALPLSVVNAYSEDVPFEDFTQKKKK